MPSYVSDNCVLHLRYRVFRGRSKHNIFNDDAVYDILWHEVAQSVEALHYKPEGHGFDSRWSHYNFSLT